MEQFASSVHAPGALLHSSELGSSHAATSTGKALSRLWRCLRRLPGQQTMTDHAYSCQRSPWPQLQGIPWARDLGDPRWVWPAGGTADRFLRKRSCRKHNTRVFRFLPQLPTGWWMHQLSLCKAFRGLGPRLIYFQRKDQARQSHNEGYTGKLKLPVGRSFRAFLRTSPEDLIKVRRVLDPLLSQMQSIFLHLHIHLRITIHVIGKNSSKQTHVILISTCLPLSSGWKGKKDWWVVMLCLLPSR